MNNYLKTIIFSGLAAIALTSCNSAKQAQSDVATKPDYTEPMDEDYFFTTFNLDRTEQTLVEQNNAFALNLYRQTASMQSHVVSPLSVTYLMAMLADGSHGQTQQEMLAALGWKDAKLADVDSLSRKLIESFPRLDRSTAIHIANYIALNQEHELLPAYVAAAKDGYKAGVESLDFNSPKTTRHINDWCSKQTDGMIPSIINEVNPSATLYAMNAIYFNGTWADKFDKAATREEAFHGYTRDIKHVQMMHQNTELQYLENDTMQAVVLPYGNGSYQMTVLLPRTGFSTTEMMAALDANALEAMRWRTEKCIVDLKLPRFTTETQTDLNDILAKLGAPTMFTAAADFTGMSADPLYVSKMLQKAKIEVSEEGTKAAAVTIAEMCMTSLNPDEPRHMSLHADHPFVYVISERTTGAILFIGQFAG